jgi:hypothetical protein
MRKISKRPTSASKLRICVPAEITPITPRNTGNGLASSAIAGKANVPARQPSRIVRAAARREPRPTKEAHRRTTKTSPIEPLQIALAARRKSQTELSDLNNLLADKSTRQSALEKTGDLHDPSVIAEIGRLQIFTRVLPHRIAAKEADDAQAEESLTTTTNEFIQQHLGPRIRKLATQTREQVETELSPHFPDRAALIVAIAQSQQVRTIEALAWTATSQPPHGAIAHAEGALKSWAAADDFEKTGNEPLSTSAEGEASVPASRNTPPPV